MSLEAGPRMDAMTMRNAAALPRGHEVTSGVGTPVAPTFALETPIFQAPETTRIMVFDANVLAGRGIAQAEGRPVVEAQPVLRDPVSPLLKM